MKIGLDASRANKPHKTGVEWYSYHLIEEFKKIDKENHYFLYTDKPLQGDLAKCPNNFEECMLAWPLSRFWTLGRLSWEMLAGKHQPDVLFVAAHTLPLIAPKRAVVTVHDIGFEHYPDLYPWADKFYHRFAIKIIKLLADKIITVSNYSKDDIVDFYKIEPQKIEVVHNGYDEIKYRVLRADQNILKKYNINSDFILFIGRLEEKKNTPRLIEAFGEFKKKNPVDKHQLVLVGKPGFGFERVEQNIKKYGLEKDVVLTGWLGDDELPQLLNLAQAFIFPSLFEGFGIPVIEAMACGCPVLCSNSTSLPEAVGEAALMFDPFKVEEIASRLGQVLQNETVQESLREKGLKQAQGFSWNKCAQETLNILTTTDNFAKI